MIAVILVFVLYYATLGVLTSYLGMKILKRANMKASFFVKFLYGLFWPVFIKHILPGIKDIICKDVVQESIKETAEYIDKIESARDKWYQQILQQQNPGTLVGNSVTPENVKIPEDAIPIQEEKVLEINCCPKCGNNDPNEFSISSNTLNTSEGLSNQDKIICNKCHDWAYIEDAKNSSWFK